MLISMLPTMGVSVFASNEGEINMSENLALIATPEAVSFHQVAPVENLNDGNTTDWSRWTIDTLVYLSPRKTTGGVSLYWTER